MAVNTTTSLNKPAENQYDVQRSQVREDEQKRRKLEKSAMERSLASRGFGAGSGFSEANVAKQQSESRQGERQRLGEIDINQLAAGELASEREKERGFITSEREAGQRYGTGEREAIQEYGTGEREAVQEYGTGERRETQGFQTGERLGAEAFAGEQAELNRGLEQQRIDEGARQFDNKLDFDVWAADQGFDEADRDRAWRAAEAAKGRNVEITENELNRVQQWNLTNLQESLASDRMILADTLQRNNVASKMRSDYAYSRGVNGQPVDLENMSQLERDAYGLGLEGRAKEDYDNWYKTREDFRNSLIVALGETENAREMTQGITDIFVKFFPDENSNLQVIETINGVQQ